MLCPNLKRAEEDCKFFAEILLLGARNRIIIPSETEWVGLNLLERDDLLERENELHERDR